MNQNIILPGSFLLFLMFQPLRALFQFFFNWRLKRKEIQYFVKYENNVPHTFCQWIPIDCGCLKSCVPSKDSPPPHSPILHVQPRRTIGKANSKLPGSRWVLFFCKVPSGPRRLFDTCRCHGEWQLEADEAIGGWRFSLKVKMVSDWPKWILKAGRCKGRGRG